jgi:predicted DCC family thiol-disulfide oxidoreductase YuxK
LQLTLAYLDTFFWKASGSKWLEGSAVYYATRMQDFMRFPLPFFLDNMFVLSLLTWGTLLVEAWLFSLIWFRKTRYTVLAVGLLMHLGIDLFINLPVFEWVFMSMFILFVYPEDLAKAAAWIRKKVSEKFGPATVLAFDGKCILCVRGVGLIHRLDVFRRIQLVDFTDEINHERLIDFDMARAQTEMLFASKKGWIGGFRAFREVAKRLPLMWVMLPILYFPGTTTIGDAVYKKVAANRYALFGRCDDGYCEIHKGGVA